MEYNKILESIKELEDYQKSDLIVDIYKTIEKNDGDRWNQYAINDLIIDTLGCLFNNTSLDVKNEVLIYLLNDIMQNQKKEFQKITEKDDGFHNVKAAALEKDYSNILEFYNSLT